MRLALCTAAAVAAAIGFAQLRPVPADRGEGPALFANLPLHFEPTANDGEFIARGRNYALRLDDAGATLHLKQGDQVATLGLWLIEAQAAAARGEKKLQGVSNYFLGADESQWRASVPHYAQVKYEAVYPGVDLIYYGVGRDLEYDFIVAPGADPRQIRLGYHGAQAVRIDDSGDLRIAVAGGEVVHRKPVVYQTLANGVRASIAGAFRLLKSSADGATSIVTFALGDYDVRLPLVIDPVLTYSTYLGATDEDAITAIAVDAAGAVYVAGETESADFPTTAGAAQTAHASPGGGETDVFIAKINPQGTALEYSTFLGGDNNDFADDIEIDGAGTLYIAGDTRSTNFPTVSAFDATFGGGNQADIFVAHLNAQGAALLYSTYLGGAGNEASSTGGADLALRVDASGSAYILSTSESNDYPVTAGAPQATRAGDPSLFADDFVITKLAANGASLLFSTYFGGIGEEELGHGQHERARAGFFVDDAGVVTVVGAAGGGFPTTAGVVQATHGGSEDVVVVQMNTATNAVVFATYLGGSGFERVGGSAIDATGAIYICGETQGPNFPTTPGAFDTTAADRDAFVAKLNSNAAALIYSTLIGGSNADYDAMCRVDAAGVAYIAGSTVSTDFPVTAGAFDTVNDFDQGFLAKLNATGTALVYATYLADELRFLEINAAGEAHVVFPTVNDSLLVTAGGRPYASNDDIYFLRLNAAGSAGLDASYLGGDDDEDINAFVLAPSGDVYIAGGTESDDFFTTPGALQTSSGNPGSSADDDAFIARIAMGDGGPPPPPQPGVVQLSAASYSVNENGGSVTLTLTRTGGADGAISVNVASGGGSAAAGSDYTALAQTVNWANGDAAAKTVALTVANDAVDEPDETVTVSLSGVTGGATIGGTSSATVTIVDDDASVVTPPPAPPPPPAAQATSVRGSYGGGALNWVFVLALAALAIGRTASAADDDAGWFLGLRGGVADSTLEAEDLERTLAARGHLVDVSVDEEEPTWTLFGGYRWSSGVGVEASVIDLGEYDVSLAGATANNGALATAVQSLLADAGRGAGAALSWRWAITDRLAVTPRAGAYYWESERVLASGGQRFRRSENGVNLMGGIALGVQLSESWSIAFGWDAYDAGSRNDVRAYSASVEYRF